VTPDGHTDVDARLQAVHQLWATFRERGPSVALELLHDEVEVVDVQGRAYHGLDGVRAFFRGFEERAERFMASPFTFELHEPDVLVVGHVRVRSDEGLRGGYFYFVHSVRDGKVARLVVHRSRESALADVRSRAQDAGGAP
jgi:ketosteroid isomerase-like protein